MNAEFFEALSMLEAERGLPAVLNMGDLEKMSASDCCFARKVDVDSELGRALLERWNG